MKELYTSPEMKLISFVPAEKLATSSLDFDDLLAGLNGGITNDYSSTSVAAGDLDLPQIG